MCSTEKGGWKCVECKQYLCNNCKVTHVKVPLLKNHHIVPAEEMDIAIDRLVFCENHTDQIIVSNCQKCEELLCFTCKETAHVSHKIETVESALQRILPEIEGHSEKIE